MSTIAYVALLDGGKREETGPGHAGPGPGLYVVELRGKRHQVDAFTLDHGAVSLLVDQRASTRASSIEREAGVRVWIAVTR